MNETPSLQVGSVLCVDLDGTLSRTDTLIETLLMLMRQKPLALLMLPVWLMRGRAAFKAAIARAVAFDPEDLRYNEELIDWLKAEKAKGRRIVLATAADERIAQAIADHLRLFDDVIASDGAANRKGRAKADALRDAYGAFVYVANGDVDVPVWQAADGAVLVAESPRMARRLAARVNFERVFEPERAGPGWRLWLKQLRLHQWAKNGLMFVPLVLSHQIMIPEKFFSVLAGFFAFSLCASSVYVLNDLLDLGSDRRHATKKDRPFASGALPLAQGLAVSPLLLLPAFAIALATSLPFAGVLVLYYFLTLAYSMELKGRVLVDVFTLAGLYTIRIVAGGVVAGVHLSPWLLAFSIFLFLSLGIVKRVAELRASIGLGLAELHGRGYRADDTPIMTALGVASGYASVVIFSLYISAPDSRELYPHHQLLWLFVPLILFWISRVWLKTWRGEMHEDPIVFALRDRVSQLTVLAAGGVLLVSAL